MHMFATSRYPFLPTACRPTTRDTRFALHYFIPCWGPCHALLEAASDCAQPNALNPLAPSARLSLTGKAFGFGTRDGVTSLFHGQIHGARYVRRTKQARSPDSKRIDIPRSKRSVIGTKSLGVTAEQLKEAVVGGHVGAEGA